MLIKRASAFDHQPPEGVLPVTFALLCGSAFITRMVLAFLEQHGFCHDGNAAITLLIDEPRGFALAALVGRQAGHSVIHARRPTRERSCSGDKSSSI